ncbi:MAG: metallophosphoesterase [Bacteroidota bacterium]|nr:metallophosphoesterase [Bacteroidota bacterium]MDP4246543.1 metallophosphoesterase [Bacteroidota bacterium]
MRTLLFIGLLMAGAQIQAAPSVRPARDSLPYFLVLSDIHLDQDLKGPDTDSSDNTSPLLWDVFKGRIDTLLRSGHSAPAFIVIPGDLPGHAHDTALVHRNIRTALRDLKQLGDAHHIPIFFVPGNNDSWDGDYSFFSDSIYADPSLHIHSPLLNAEDARGKAAIRDLSKWKELGCYTADPLGKPAHFRLIGLNTVMFVHEKKHPYGRPAGTQEENIFDQLAWLAKQLQTAQEDGAHCLIVMHVPPGADGYSGNELWSFHSAEMPDATEPFLSLLKKYQDQIVGLVAGHSHCDGVRLLVDQTGKNLITCLISAPGVTPGHGNNPAFKLIYYRSPGYILDDFVTWYTTPDASPGHANWKNFDFRQECHERTPLSIAQLLGRMDPGALRKVVERIYFAYRPAETISSPGKAIDQTIEVREK